MVRSVLDAVCAHYKVPHTTMLSRNRTARIAWARLMFCTVARELTPAFDVEIAGVIERDRDIVNYAETEVRARVKGSELETVTAIVRQAITPQPREQAA
jgi:chromosomal replication initiation ATPase DnaA